MSARRALLAVAFVCALAASPAAQAAEIGRSGATIIFSGAIVNGDQLKFKEVLGRSGSPPAQLVNLDSGGGKIEPAGDIARLIRANGLATMVNAARAKCASACTVIFVSGARRYYLNAEGLSEGAMSKSNFLGLGFHQGNSKLSLERNNFSGRATAQMIAFYYEFGVSGAAKLADKAPPEQYYRISGATALSLGIATSLRGP
jgi:hypothetical protein